ncbi:PQQ-binding-like beta-propeller repeat protein [Natrarchaeobaculum sulfurireducens]|uniref:WD40/PQQ-like beta propeller repeat containing protein n=1 Tax=Natrarchaeobaculum sulfurireducens TaxID=2044521 RepID=A0A346PCQ9_9EURY|nr:PQQ-binding-like beta-propeller repeat protein [Natrarchaeobaculum sulfurireducens]AXR77304.1 WD40/PQQ-like beta propeller repeat containing protein [Natrarchaeobaculum sulfurireducens]
MPSRRTMLTSAAVACAGVVAGCAAPDDRTPNLSGEWTQLGYDATNRNAALDRTVPGSVATAWTAPTDRWPYVPPIVATDAVFLAASDSVRSLEARDGTERWHRILEGRIAAGLAVSDDVVLVPEHRLDDPDRLRALDLEDGKAHWTLEFESRPFAPSVADGRVVCRTQEACLAVESGEILWRTELDQLAYDEYNVPDADDLTSTIAPAVTADAVAVPDHDALVCLDPDDGTERWRVDLHGAISSPVAIDGAIVALGVHETVAVEADGTERWRIDRGGWGAIAAADEHVYTLARNGLSARSVADGDAAWEVSAGNEIYRGQPAIVGDAVLMADDDLLAVDRDGPGLASSGEVFRVGDDHHATTYGGVAVGAGRIFVVDGFENRLVAFEPES